MNFAQRGREPQRARTIKFRARGLRNDNVALPTILTSRSARTARIHVLAVLADVRGRAAEKQKTKKKLEQILDHKLNQETEWAMYSKKLENV